MRFLRPIVCVVLLAACGKSEPVPPAGSGIEAPVVAADLPADLTFRWPEPARARVTLRLDGGGSVMAVAADLTLDKADQGGVRRLSQSAWRPAGGAGDGLVAGLMGGLSDDGLEVRADGTSASPTGGALWMQWVEMWTEHKDLPEGTEKVVPGGSEELPPGVEAGMTRVGASPLGARLVRLLLRFTALDDGGRRALGAMMDLSERVERDKGLPDSLRYVADVDPRTLQPVRVEMVAAFARSTKDFSMLFEFDWVP